MRLTHLRNLLAPVDGIASITAMCWTSETSIAASSLDEPASGKGKQDDEGNDGDGENEEDREANTTGPRLAVATSDRIVHLFDESGERRDKFSTKPADKVRTQFHDLV